MTKLKQLGNFISHMKIRTKLILLVLVTGAACMLLFRFLWLHKWYVYYTLAEEYAINPPFLPRPADDFWIRLNEEAEKYNIPDSEEDKEAVEAVQPFFSLADAYTSIYIYGLEDGMYRAGHIPEAMEDDAFHFFFRTGYRWTDGVSEESRRFPLKFKNGYAEVIVIFYHSSFFIFPYFLFCLAACVLLFFAVLIFSVRQKMKTVIRLKQNILQMSSGDLSSPIPAAGGDELGILAAELDNLRSALHKNIQHEQEVHRSNQELIAALSHDLRTPLTILKGYLEIIRLNRNQMMQEEYVERCIQKTNDIQEMTDRMFEYALVFDEGKPDADILLSSVPPACFFETLKEHSEFLQIAGFQTSLCLPELSPESAQILFPADISMVKRVFNNLFSNILKYADKKETVLISASLDNTLTIRLKNAVKKEYDGIQSTQIGLKSVRRIMEQMKGTFQPLSQDGFFTAKLCFTPSPDPIRQTPYSKP